MKKKKVLALILSTVLSIGLLLTGCAGKETGSDSGNNNGGSGVSSGNDDRSNDVDSDSSNSEGSNDNVQGKVTTIKVGTPGMPSPYIFIDENNELQGFDIEVLKAVFERLPQYELKFEVTEFGSVFTGLNSGNYQLAVGNYGYNEDRAQSYLYSFPYDKAVAVFVTRPGEEIHSLTEAAGKTFENTPGTNIANALEHWNEENPDLAINIKYVENENLLEHIFEGNAEFTIIDKAMFEAYMPVFGYDLVATVAPDEDQRVLGEDAYAYFMLPKTAEGEALRAEINAVLKELYDDGTLQSLSEAIYGWDQIPDADAYVTTIN